MGNRAVITTEKALDDDNAIGVYVHWCGDIAHVRAFLAYCKIKEYGCPENHCYGWARLCQVIGNYFYGTISVGVDVVSKLDFNNWDNGTYIIRDWKIVGHKFCAFDDKNNDNDINFDDLLKIILEIDESQPAHEQMYLLDEHDYDFWINWLVRNV